MATQTHLGEMLRLYRTVRGLTLREMAPPLRVSHATLQRIEHGYPCDAATLLKIWQWMLSDIPKPDRLTND